MDGHREVQNPETRNILRVSRGGRCAARGCWALLAVAVFLPAVGYGQGVGRLLDGPSPWPTSAAVDNSSKGNGAGVSSAPVNAGAPVSSATSASGMGVASSMGAPVGVGISPTTASNVTGNGAASKDPVKTPVVGGSVNLTPPVVMDVKPSEPAKTSSGAGGATGVSGETETPKPTNDIERTAIGGRREEPTAGSTEKKTSSGWGFSGVGGAGQTVAALAVVVGLILIGKALVKKFVPGAAASNGKGVIEILARHPLAKNQSIVLVRIGSQIVALNQGRESSESVLVISDTQEVARIIGQIEGKNPQSIQAGFNKLLANARMDLETEREPEENTMSGENIDEQLEEMAAAKRQLMELRQHVRSVRDSLPRD